MASFGATPEDWLHWDLMLGLGADLLPVVSDPGATISDNSKMKALGKTPSRFNADGTVSGIAGWTQIQATPKQLSVWSKEDRYGLCVQTRTVRAIDIDVPDVALAGAISELVQQHFGNLPARTRPGSGKRLHTFLWAGPLRKRAVKVQGGLVEILADGQQFVAVGTHPSGARYEWEGGLPSDIPAGSLEQLNAFWADLELAFALEPPVEGRGPRVLGEDLGVDDPVAEWLEQNWENYGYRDGKLLIACPWKSGHSVDSGETETAWLLRGTQGHPDGHFSCRHASCARRLDPEFERIVGYTLAGFEDLGPDTRPRDRRADVVDPASDPARLYEALSGGVRLPLPNFKRDGSGAIEPVLPNVVKALHHAEACGAHVAFDTFRAEMVVSTDGANWQAMEDADAVDFRIALEAAMFKPVGREMMRDALVKVARDRQFDSAQLWLSRLPAWDGVDRIEGFYAQAFGSEDTPYTRACGLYTWTGLAGRVMDPGCQADMALILTGEQGTGKSSAVKAIAPSEETYAELGFAESEADRARKMRGVLVVELAELKGLHSSDAETIRAWVSRRWEKWIPKFKEFSARFPRRCIMFGTSNPEEVLADDTGERRWLPMRAPAANVSWIVANRDQLWAEGLARWQSEGVIWREAEHLAKAEHAQFKVRDMWQPLVERWLQEADIAGVKPADRGYILMADVVTEGLRLDLSRAGRKEEMRVGRILAALGYKTKVAKIDGKSVRVWAHG